MAQVRNVWQRVRDDRAHSVEGALCCPRSPSSSLVEVLSVARYAHCDVCLYLWGWLVLAMWRGRYTEAGRSIDDLIKERVFEREQIAALAKLKESVRQKQREKKIAREAKIRRQQEAVVMRRERQHMSAEDIASSRLRDADAKLPGRVTEGTLGDAVARHVEAQAEATAQGQTKLALQPTRFTFTAHFELQALKAGPSAFSQLTSVLEKDPRLVHALPVRSA